MEIKVSGCNTCPFSIKYRGCWECAFKIGTVIRHFTGNFEEWCPIIKDGEIILKAENSDMK